MNNKKINNWKKYGFEFLLIFIAVISGFALNNWNESKKSDNTENKILTEIYNGLEKDLIDIKQNMTGHKNGIKACAYFKKSLYSKVNSDSIQLYHFSLTRDFISVQNTAGYETLKSKGLETITNDSLRQQIISLYAFDYYILKKLEEDYEEMQYQKNYAKDITNFLIPNLIFNSNNDFIGLNSPLNITEAQKNKFALYLYKIKNNRKYILSFYKEIESKITILQNNIKKEINQ